MDLSAIIVVLVLTALSFAAIVWLEIYSRRSGPEKPIADEARSNIKNNTPHHSVPKNRTNRA